MSVLIIDPDVIELVRRVKDYAIKHLMNVDEMKSILLNKKSPVGDRPKHSIIIPNNFRVVYSVEEQIDAEIYHHLSVSLINKEKSLPSIPAVEEIMGLFGMGKNIKNCRKIWVENGIAVNILKNVKDESKNI
jgi:hypothetical protein